MLPGFNATPLTREFKRLMLRAFAYYSTSELLAFRTRLGAAASGANNDITSLSALTRSMVRLNTGNGYGSTNNKIRRFLNTVTNQGTDITYADSASLGATFTINVNGIYAISYSDQFSNICTLGLTLNDTTPTAVVSSVSADQLLIAGTSPATDYAEPIEWSGYLPAGSVIRAHTDGVASGTNIVFTQFTIARVG